MAKLGDMVNPISGTKINFSIMGVVGMVLGAALILWVIDLGTSLKNMAKTFIPGSVPFIGYQAPVAQQAASKGIELGAK